MATPAPYSLQPPKRSLTAGPFSLLIDLPDDALYSILSCLVEQIGTSASEAIECASAIDSLREPGVSPDRSGASPGRIARDAPNLPPKPRQLANDDVATPAGAPEAAATH